jgi:hypothetical protein
MAGTVGLRGPTTIPANAGQLERLRPGAYASAWWTSTGYLHETPSMERDQQSTTQEPRLPWTPPPAVRPWRGAWGTLPQCDEVNANGARCALVRGHDGNHWTAAQLAVERGPSEPLARRAVLLAVALGAGLAFGLLWYPVAEHPDLQQDFDRFVMLSVAIGGIAGLWAGLAGRGGLLLAWLAAVMTGASMAVHLALPQPEAGEAVGYLAIALLLFVGGPAAAGWALGWVGRRFRAGRPPAQELFVVAFTVLYLLLPEGVREIGILTAIVVLALVVEIAWIVVRAVRRRGQQLPPP